MSAHLQNAAVTLQLILARSRPENAWCVQVGESDRDDARGDSAAALGNHQRRPEGQREGSGHYPQRDVHVLSTHGYLSPLGLVEGMTNPNEKR